MMLAIWTAASMFVLLAGSPCEVTSMVVHPPGSIHCVSFQGSTGNRDESIGSGMVSNEKNCFGKLLVTTCESEPPLPRMTGPKSFQFVRRFVSSAVVFS